MRLSRLVASVAVLFTGAALAQQVAAPAATPNLEKLKQFKVSGTDLNIKAVDQGGTNAAAIKENLKRIKMPSGFKIDLFAMVPDARHMAIAPSANMLFVGTRKTTV
jgi:hypothetical protein